MNITFHKWNKDEVRILTKSCDSILGVNGIQFYQPYYSLYFNIHNTKNSHQRIDLRRRYYVHEILDISNKKYHTSNTFLKCKIFDSLKNLYQIEEVFCKCIPLLDPLFWIMCNYNNFVPRNGLLPSGYNYNTYDKINNMNNNAYIDTFMSFICSEITTSNLNPSFPIFYGSLNGIKKEYNFDISEDYYSLKKEPWFYKNLTKHHIKLDMYVSSDEEGEEEEEEEEDDEECSSSDSDPSISDSDPSISDSDLSSGNSNDYIVLLEKLPVQLFFIEKLQGTLEDLLTRVEELNTDLILSCLFQVSFALMYLQKYYEFTHNDLHINNVMFTSTNKTFLYYKFNNIYYKVPTYGYLFKIIDFGRSIFTFHNRLFFNDTFEKHGEAEGQYSKPFNKLSFQEKENTQIKQNFNFDLCRLAITILDVCEFNKNINYGTKQAFIDFVYNMTLTDKCESLYDLEDDFNMYVAISKHASNALPKNIIQNIIFNNYRIKKKEFPKKSYYSL
jgi:hypothetical protein